MNVPSSQGGFRGFVRHSKWNLWHGKVSAGTRDRGYALDVKDASPEHRKLLKVVRVFQADLSNNRAFIPNYGERYRQGKTIATSFVESALNQVVSKRFVRSSRCAGPRRALTSYSKSVPKS